jgi:purine/pyrimidine-nucleoside phosphorylase
MFKTNEYFGGKVVSLAFQPGDDKATIGVIAKGEYEFGTSTIEFMTVITGKMDVMIPDSNAWKEYKKGETYKIEKDMKFKVKVEVDTAYLCIYK